jgi:hypothetical protein
MNIVPFIGSRGVFTLTAPFNTILTANTPYTCQAIRTLSDIVAEGGDPYTTYYQANNIPKSKYQSDLADGVAIISLQSDGGVWAYVPSSYIASYPMTNGVKYRAMVIAVSLGTVPDDLDLSGLESDLADYASNMIGVKAAAKTMAVTDAQLVDHDTYKSLEAIRTSRITNNTSLSLQNAELKNENATLQNRIKQLSDFIKKMWPSTIKTT